MIKQQQKSICCTLAILSATVMAMSGCNKAAQDPAQQKQTATVISHRSYLDGKYPTVQILLDKDEDPRTTEAICELPPPSIRNLTPEDVEQILPKGSKRSVWEWKRIGRYVTLGE